MIFYHHDGTALFVHAILTPLILSDFFALITAVVSIVALVSVVALVCVVLCLQFCVTRPTNSSLTNPLFPYV